MTRPADTSCSQILSLGSDPELRRRFMVLDDDIPGNFRFGLLLEQLDLLAEKTALNYVRQTHADGRVVTAAIDNIVVRHVADVTRDVVCHARLNHVGRSSLEVGIRVEQPGEPVNHIATCHFTMVARGGPEAGESLPLPPLTYATDKERERAGRVVASREEYRRQQESLQHPPTAEEYAELERLHHAQEEPDFSGQRTAGLVVVDSFTY